MDLTDVSKTPPAMMPRVSAPSAPSHPGHPLAWAAGGMGVSGLGAGVGWWVYVTRDWKLILFAAGGLLLITLLLLGLRALWRSARKKRETRLGQQLRDAGQNRPADARPEEIATNDDLAREFEKGLAKFRAAGKSVYSLPWYLIVGEPGGGKTEAMRHSNVGFPPGLQDPMQGAGGTYSMSWWFTNRAVLIDTAGRLMFGDRDKDGALGEGYRNVWFNFLDTLKKSRPAYPINGLILVIPATSLLVDPAEEIEAKGAVISQNLDLIQKRLGVRFPVFVVVTKCDKITGFKPFFETVDDPVLQHQMLGWSNPASLDEPFDPAEVGRHFDALHAKLRKRRTTVLAQVAARQDSERRLDTVDELYDFPDAFRDAVERLRRYLELTFVAGEWSKPLFLRGIYFTSSMREGDALDLLVSDITGVPAEQIPEGRQWAKDKAYFLRDVFTEKVFREHGLVTTGKKVGNIKRKHQLSVAAAALAALLLLGGLFGFGAYQLSDEVEQSTFWGRLVDRFGTDSGAITFAETTEDGEFRQVLAGSANDATYTGDTGEGTPLEEIHRQAPAQLEKTVTARGIFKLPAWVMRDQLANATASASGQRAAYRPVFRGSVSRPLLDRLWSRSQESDANPSPAVIDALVQLFRFERAIATQDVQQAGELSLAPLWVAVLDENALRDVDVAAYDAALRAAHGVGSETIDWPALERTLLRHDFDDERIIDPKGWGGQLTNLITAPLDSFRLSGPSERDTAGADTALQAAVDQFTAAETALGELSRQPVTTTEEYEAFREQWAQAVANLQQAGMALQAARNSFVESLGGTQEKSLEEALHARRETVKHEMAEPLRRLAEFAQAPEESQGHQVYDEVSAVVTREQQRIDAEADEVGTRLAAMPERLVGHTSEDGPRWQVVVDVYARVRDDLAPLDTLVSEAANEATVLADALKQVDEELPAEAGSAEADGADAVAAYVRRNVLAPAKRHTAVRQVIEQTQPNSTAIGEAVAQLSEAQRRAAEVPDRLSLPSLPLVAPLEEPLASKFDPWAAEVFAQQWQAVAQVLSGGEVSTGTDESSAEATGDPVKVLDVPALSEMDLQRRLARLAYLTEYGNYWQAMLDELLTPQLRVWDGSHAQRMDEESLTTGVKALAALLGQAKRVQVPAGTETDADATAEATAAIEPLASRGLRVDLWASDLESGQLPPQWERWKQLPADPGAAADRIREEATLRQFRQMYLVDDDQRDPQTRYYHRLTAALLPPLAAVAPVRNPAGVGVDPARLAALEFPLKPFDGNGEMTREEMKALVENDLPKIFQLQQEVTDEAEEIDEHFGPGAGAGFAKLYGLSDGNLDGVQAIYAWLQGRDPEGLGFPRFSISIPAVAEQTEALRRNGKQGAAQALDQIGVIVGSRRDVQWDKPIILTAADESVDGAKLMITYVDPRTDDPTHDGSIPVEVERWRVIHWLDRYGVAVLDENNRRVRLEVDIHVGNENALRPLWLEVEFDRPLPEPLLERIRRR